MDSLKMLLSDCMIVTLGITFGYMIIQLVRKIFSGVNEEMWGKGYSSEEVFIDNK